MGMHEKIEECLSVEEALRFKDGAVSSQPSEVCREENYRLYLNDTFLVSLVASPAQLRELGVGFVISAGLARAVSDVQVQGDEIRVFAADAALARPAIMESSGGQVLDNPPPRVVSDLTLTRDDIFRVIAAIVSELWRRTGGAHCSVLFARGVLAAKSSDVGRHNTVDKVIGTAVLQEIDPGQCILGCTGRQPAGMIAKAAHAGIPVVVSKAATTQRGVMLAEQAGITLIGRVKEREFTAYTHPHRIVDLWVD